MPFYEYCPDADGCDYCRDGFEARQSINDPALRSCPRCGAACHRVFSAFHTGVSDKALLSPQNIARHGFTQYKRKGKGYYEKTAGSGPQAIAA